MMKQFKKIQDISNQVGAEVLILFWQFAISSLEELDIVSNQHLSIEMFLIRLMHLSSIKLKKKPISNLEDTSSDNNKIKQEPEVENGNKTIDQIKNITQEKKNKPEIETDIKA